MNRLSLWREAVLMLGVKPDYTDIKKEQIRNANQGSAASFLYSIVATLMAAFYVPSPFIYVPIIGSFLYLVGLWFSYKHWHDLAGLSSWFISILLFFWLAGAYGKTSNAYLLFIIGEILAIYNFKLYNDKWLIIQLIIPILFSIIAYLTDFSLFLIPTIGEKERAVIDPIMYFTVITSCATIVWFYGKHIQKHFAEMDAAKNALQEKYEELERANLQLSKTNEELDKFVYSVSHDLRAPITSVMGLVELCKTDKENIDLYLSLQDKSMHKLDNFIKDILHYARNSRLEVVPIPLNLSQIIKEVFESQCYAQSAENIDLQVNVKGDAAIYNDDFRFNIILGNIISNAIRYRKNNVASYLHFDIDLTSKQAIIVIKDNGIGIPAQHLPNIFQMFYRANAKVSGSGLGLYIVKEAIHKMKGSIEVRSTEGEGTEFSLVIPNLQKAQL